MADVFYGLLKLWVISAKDLKNADGWGTGNSDPYVEVFVGKTKIGQTKVIDNNLNPEWNERFDIVVSDSPKVIRFVVWDKDLVSSDFLGEVHLAAADIIRAKGKFKDALKLNGKGNAPSKEKLGKLNIKISYTSFESLREQYEVPDVPFKMHHGCRVTLFQDAHIGEAASLLPRVIVTPSLNAVTSSTGNPLIKKKKGDDSASIGVPPSEPWEYVRPNCWEKVYKAIQQAKVFIYITGWSVDTNISLLRNPEGLTMGELLKQKAAEGVRVLLLLWNEATSTSFKQQGLMCTHDEQTQAYFKGTGVTVKLAYRDGDVSSGNQFIWTHHQKSVIVDSEALHSGDDDFETEDGGTSKRRIIAFIGGLDLCDGRWDTPQHSLYRTLQNEHKRDFHTVWPGVTQEFGPREPWHDIHSRLEGPVCRDIMRNFEQRWRKQAPNKVDRLIDLSQYPQIISQNEEQIFDKVYWDSWSVQLFRSIDHYSAHMETSALVDNSIHEAYVYHIRRAERFIYIENQYFLGSSQYWENGHGNDVSCHHAIPYELVTKIVSSINEGKPFCVYVLLPMYPEGNPTDGAVQEILHWQYRTIEMMYARIHRALEAKGLLGTRTPEDYLNFYCLGQRETVEGSQAVGGTYDAAKDPQKYQLRLNESRRFAIYVHSKMMIIDDEYVIVGSANINQRSMDGARDSEIAVGVTQPHFNTHKIALGQVHAFRVGLWTSHTRKFLPSFLHPESAECAREVNAIARKAWEVFTQPQVEELEPYGQLLKYPYSIRPDGTLHPLESSPLIPDTTAKVIGEKSLVLLNILTT